MFARFFRGYNPSYPLKKDKKRSFIGVQIKGLVLQGAVYNRVPGCVCVCVSVASQQKSPPGKRQHLGSDSITACVWEPQRREKRSCQSQVAQKVTIFPNKRTSVKQREEQNDLLMM